MSAPAKTPEIDANRTIMITALRKSAGRVTVGDAVAATGLSNSDAEDALRSLLSTHEGHLEVTDEGELVYLFDPKVVARDERTGWEKFKDSSWRAFKFGFKIWIMTMLVVYFVIYVTLAIAAFIAITSQNKGSSSSSSRSSYGSSRSGNGFSIWWLFYLFWTPDYKRGSTRYYGDTYQGQHKGKKEAKIPFYLKVFAFVFGPDEPEEDARERDQKIAAWIRGNAGVVTTAELVELTGLSFREADSEMGRILGAFGGDAHITDEGEVVYSFQDLMLSADGSAATKSIPPAWHKLEVPRKVTGNTSKANGLIGFFNGFNLFFALISPAILFPILGIGGSAANVGLVIVPFIFSLLFFAVPFFRSFGVRGENKRRHERNVRKLVLKGVFDSARNHRPMQQDAVAQDVSRALKQVKTEGAASVIGHTISATNSELEAEGSGGSFRYPVIEQSLDESNRTRAEMRLGDQRVGDVVYSSGESDDDAAARELDRFDELVGGEQLNEREASWEQRQELDQWEEQLEEDEVGSYRH